MDKRFKVWDLNEKKMCDLVTLDYDKGNPAVFVRSNVDSYWIMCDRDYILLQYSNSNDIDDNEFYEGDIAEVPSDGYNEKEIIIVYFRDGCFSVDPVYIKHNKIKKIGNIYENPELMPKEIVKIMKKRNIIK